MPRRAEALPPSTSLPPALRPPARLRTRPPAFASARPPARRADSCCSFPAVDPAGPPWAPLTNSTVNASCPCAYCKGMCPGGQCGGGEGAGAGTGDGSAYGADLPWWNGLDPVLIGAVWGAVAAFAIAHTIALRFAASAEEKAREGGK